jgi:methanogenic corrinoid protein MtbC1
MNSPDKLVQFIADLDEEQSLEAVRQRLAQGYDALRLLKTCQEGVRLVGKRYEEGSYFIAGLIMGGEILRLAVEVIKPELEKSTSAQSPGRIVLGTVKGDIHDIGKNIVSTLLSCQGFEVIDLGVDVDEDVFVRAVAEHSPQILGLSCLLTTAFASMKSTIAALEEAGLRRNLPIIIGGNSLDDETCRYARADYWTNDAMDGVGWCQRLFDKEQSRVSLG